MKKFQGLVVAMVTPFHADGSVNYDMERKLLRHFVSQGVSGILVSGGTGEFPTLSLDERKEIISVAAEELKDTDVFVLAGITCSATRDTVALAAHCGNVGADYLLVQPPHGFPVSREGMMAYFREIKANTSSGLVLYHFPAETGVTFSPEDIIEMGREGLFDAVKNTASMEHTMELLLLNEHNDSLSISNGFDSLALSALACGADSLINAGSNMTPAQYVAIMNYMKQGNLAKALEIYEAILPLLLYQEQDGNTEPGLCKYVLSLQGFDCGVPRKPMTDIPAEAKEKVKELLAKAEAVVL